MKELIKRIQKDGIVKTDDMIKVDTFLNHQVDPQLMDQIGQEFAKHFSNRGITKVFAIESSGISPALMTSLYLGVPMVILKKQSSKLLGEPVYQTRITSFTSGTSFELTISKEFIKETDRILLIDDILSNGETAMGALRLVDMAGARLEGVGIVIEKSFQRGRQRLNDAGCEVVSLAQIRYMNSDEIIIEEA